VAGQVLTASAERHRELFDQLVAQMTPQLLVKEIFDTSPRFEELRRMLLAEWRAGPERWSPWARQVFEELGLDEDPAGWRPLAESPAFLAALREDAAAEVA
jgi:hypothetical protein